VRVAVEIVLSDDEVLELSKASKSRSVSVRFAERSRIVLLAAKGMTNEEIGKELGLQDRRPVAGASAMQTGESKASSRMRIDQGENQKSVHVRSHR